MSAQVTDSMAAEFERRADQAELAAEAHKRRVGPVDMGRIIRLQQTALDYHKAAREVEAARKDSVTLEFETVYGRRHRETFDRGDDGRLWRTEEVRETTGWRTVGVEEIDALSVR